jgi:arsenite-transporting ATPase
VTNADRLTALLAPVTLVVGKGGVGKTTIAAALARRFSRTARTLVVTTDPAGTLLPALGMPVRKTVAPIAAASIAHPPTQLDVWAIDTAGVRDLFLERWHEPITTILDRGTYLDADDIRGLVDATLPGADEIFALLALGEILGRTGPDAYERVVIDTAPTGHTLRLLNLPQSFDAVVRLLDAMQEKHRFMVTALTHRYRTDAADALIAELRGRVATLQRILADSKQATALLVARPEHVVLAESKRYLEQLAAAHIGVAAAVINAADDRVAPFDGSIPQFVVPRLRQPLDALDHLSPADAKGRDFTRVAAPTGKRRPAAAASVSGLARPLTIVAGKGGVGKTTVACAIAAAVADSGKSTLLVSTDPAPSVADALDQAIGDEEVAVRGIERLTARQMNATNAFAAFRDQYQARIDQLFDGITGKGLDVAHDREILRDLLSLAPPGIDEVYALSFLGTAIDEKRFDCIVVDPAPTGHLIRLLDLPALAVSWSHQLMRLMLKYKDIVGLGDAAEELLAFAKRTRGLEERLRDPALTGAVLVTLDEPLVRGESERLAGALSERGIGITGIVTNRGGVSKPIAGAESIPRLTAPLLSPPPVGLAAIRDLANRGIAMQP